MYFPTFIATLLIDLHFSSASHRRLTPVITPWLIATGLKFFIRIPKINRRFTNFIALVSVMLNEHLLIAIIGAFMILRNYQESAIQQLMAFVQDYQIDEGIGLCEMPTGSGKTLTATSFLKRFLATNPETKILWLAPEWQLLAQALDCFVLALGDDYTIRRIGKGQQALQHLPDDIDGQIFLTTPHSLKPSRLKAFNHYRSQMLVVLDEAHWGINAKMIESVFQFCREVQGQEVPIIGLSATPRLAQGIPSTKVVQINYADMVSQGFLARPFVHTIPTNCSWDPIFNSRGRITSQSFSDLNTEDRNILISRTVYSILSSHQRRGILFALNIDHALTLYKRLKDIIPTSIVHGKSAENERMIEMFCTGQHRLMIAINKLTMGFDVPEITDVFLARPCESEVLLAQMIGRGSRIVERFKNKFHVHDFFDTITENKADKIFHGNDYFNDSAYRRPTTYTYPDQLNKVILDEDFGPWSGFSFIDNMTFGIELEITKIDGIPSAMTPQWIEGANLLIEALNRAVGPEWVYQSGILYHQSASLALQGHWRVESDSSAGWEVISPILSGTQDLKYLIAVCQELNQLILGHEWFHINHRCGFHLTLASNLSSPKQRRRKASMISRLEPGLYSLLALSRIYEFQPNTKSYNLNRHNRYCMPLRSDSSAFKSMISNTNGFLCYAKRHTSVNFTRFDNTNHILEVRMHNGTVDASKIIPWISLWMKILTTNSPQQTIEVINTPIYCDQRPMDHEDILKLLKQEGIELEPEMTASIFRRRKNLRERWRRYMPDKIRQWEAAGFYDTECYGL